MAAYHKNVQSKLNPLENIIMEDENALVSGMVQQTPLFGNRTTVGNMFIMTGADHEALSQDREGGRDMRQAQKQAPGSTTYQSYMMLQQQSRLIGQIK